jgi:hypothetical protein
VLFVATIIVRKIGEIHATSSRRFDAYNPQPGHKPQAFRNRQGLTPLGAARQPPLAHRVASIDRLQPLETAVNHPFTDAPSTHSAAWLVASGPLAGRGHSASLAAQWVRIWGNLAGSSASKELSHFDDSGGRST